MALGLALGKLKSVGNGTTKILLEKDNQDNTEPINNLFFVSGITHLAYTVIYNLLIPLDAETGIGSKMTSVIGAGGFTSNNRIQAALEITQELMSFEVRFKQFQSSSKTSLPDEQLLQRLDIINIDLDYETQTVTITLKIYNKLGQGVVVEL